MMSSVESGHHDQVAVPVAPRVAVVVATIGERHDLDRLFKSIEAQTLKPVRVIVVDQSDGDYVRSAALAAGVEYVTSQRGLSVARNAGIRALGDDWDLVAIPDDDIWYVPSAFANAARAYAETGSSVAGHVVWDEGGSRMWQKTSRERLTPATVWRGAIEPGLFLSRESWLCTGGFDIALGLGAKTPWQSGEGTDYLLRSMAAGVSTVFDPSVTAYEENPTPADVNESVARSLKYARGTGRVYALHYSRGARVRLLARSIAKVVMCATKGPRQRRVSVAIARGRIEGLGLLASP